MGLIQKEVVFPGKRTDKAEEEGLDHSQKSGGNQAKWYRLSFHRLGAGGEDISILWAGQWNNERKN